MADDYSPIWQGDTSTPLSIQFNYTNGGAYNITGATISMTMEYENDPTNVKTCTGTWTIDDAVNGKAHYQWQSADVNQAGLWKLWIVVTIGGKAVHPDDGQGNPKLLLIKPIS